MAEESTPNAITMDIHKIMSLLPHRYPFLLVDRVVECVPGDHIKAYKNVSFNEPFFQGHFPGAPVMPGVLILEALAQTGGCAILFDEENRGKIALFGGVKKCRFRREVMPGDVLELSCEITAVRGEAGFGKGVAMVDGEIACEAELSFVIKGTV